MIESHRICCLITDFGTKDYFAGVMKGVMKNITSEIEIIDLCNDIPSYSLLPASFTIDKTYQYFPNLTTFLVVVDPGVGTERRILLAEHDNKYFIAPDNGVLTPILNKKLKVVGVVDNKKYFLIDHFSTFEARDKMAPIAAQLAKGVEPWEIASPTSEFILNPDYYPDISSTTNGIQGRIVYIDKFGNIMTNVTEEYLFHILSEMGQKNFKIEYHGKQISKFYDTYEHATSESDPFMLIGSHQNLEIAMKMQPAAKYFNATIGQQLMITFY